MQDPKEKCASVHLSGPGVVSLACLPILFYPVHKRKASLNFTSVDWNQQHDHKHQDDILESILIFVSLKLSPLIFLKSKFMNCFRDFPRLKHMDKVRLTNEDLRKGNTLSAEKRVGKEDGGLA